jgi:hypothetical protein
MVETREIRRIFRIRRPVRLLVSDVVAVPVTWGILAPVIVLPQQAGSWSPETRRMVLLHELAHVQRLDVLWRAVAQLTVGIFWFNPLMWFAARRLDTEAEHACDDAVIRAGIRPSRYVRELVRIARAATAVRAPLQGVVALGALPLTGRARAILDLRRLKVTEHRASSSLMLAGIAAAVLPLAALRQAPPVPGLSAASMGVATSRARAAPATACIHRGGAHVNRWADAPGGALVWEVSWSGDTCEVRFTASGVGLATWGFGIAAIEPHGRIVVDVRDRTRALSLTITQDADGSPAYRLREAGKVQDDGEARAWFRAFLPELDHHTGFAAAWRVKSLLDRGGIDLVLAEVGQMQGDHAAGVYLRELVKVVRLDETELSRVLLLAAESVANDAVLTDVLIDLARRYDIVDAVAMPSYAVAVARLESRAARDAAIAAIERPTARAESSRTGK